MARKKDLTEAAQNATRAIFGTAAGLPETSEQPKEEPNADLDRKQAQDAPVDAQKPKRGRPKKETKETIELSGVLGAQTKEREKAKKEGRLVTVQVHIPTEEELKKTATAGTPEKAAGQKTDLEPIRSSAEKSKPKQKNRTKPNSDFIRLDLKTAEADLKKYVAFMAGVEGISMTKYIQKVLLQDMKRNKGKTFSPGK